MVVFDGLLHVHYGQAYVPSGEADWDDDMDVCFRGQTTGLLGAASRGQLFLMTGLHTGNVSLRVEVLAAEPPLDERWEECVEASFEPGGETRLVDWDGNLVCDLPLDRQPYRVRYHANGMDAGHEADAILEEEDPLDEYLLIFWPGPLAADRIVKQTSGLADYWHRWAQSL